MKGRTKVSAPVFLKVGPAIKGIFTFSPLMQINDVKASLTAIDHLF
jgi:hypothetical protein